MDLQSSAPSLTAYGTSRNAVAARGLSMAILV
jgi:hypothetical protein